MRPLVNKEIAAMMGISERTVIRWKKKGVIPSRNGQQVFLIDLLNGIALPPVGMGEGRAS